MVRVIIHFLATCNPIIFCSVYHPWRRLGETLQNRNLLFGPWLMIVVTRTSLHFAFKFSPIHNTISCMLHSLSSQTAIMAATYEHVGPFIRGKMFENRTSFCMNYGSVGCRSIISWWLFSGPSKQLHIRIHLLSISTWCCNMHTISSFTFYFFIVAAHLMHYQISTQIEMQDLFQHKPSVCRFEIDVHSPAQLPLR